VVLVPVQMVRLGGRGLGKTHVPTPETTEIHGVVVGGQILGVGEQGDGQVGMQVQINNVLILNIGVLGGNNNDGMARVATIPMTHMPEGIMIKNMTPKGRNKLGKHMKNS